MKLESLSQQNHLVKMCSLHFLTIILQIALAIAVNGMYFHRIYTEIFKVNIPLVLLIQQVDGYLHLMKDVVFLRFHIRESVNLNFQ